MYLLLFRLLILGLSVFILLDQVAVPAIRGTKLFPWFRGRRNKLQKELTDTRETLELQDTESNLNNLKSRIIKDSKHD